MNIVTPIPSTMAFPTANIQTEAARRENVLRETIPESASSDQGAAEQGLGSESDQLKRNGQKPAPVTYEKPQSNAGVIGAEQGSGESIDQDNAQDESAGKEDAERQQQQAKEAEVQELKQRDTEVRNHEQAHAAMGGQYASAPSYEFETGPNGQRYAVDGEVSIDVSKAETPQQTIKKMQQVRAAALAPAEPSPQDLRVANEASKLAFEARAELAEQQSEKSAPQSRAEKPSNEVQADDVEGTSANPFAVNVPTLEEIVENGGITSPNRTLDEALESSGGGFEASVSRTLEIDQELMGARNQRIQAFYQQVSEPQAGGFSASA